MGVSFADMVVRNEDEGVNEQGLSGITSLI